MAGSEVLKVENLSVNFRTSNGVVHAVRNVSFSVCAGKTYGLVGESGSGKSTTSLAIMRALASNGEIVGGRILYQGEDILQKTEKEVRTIRGKNFAMVFQDPENCLNPTLKIGKQLAETIQLHEGVSKKEAFKKSVDMLEKVNISDPNLTIYKYPHQLSGGQKQRILIAMALSCNPDVLILDEPTTALDVTTEANILDLVEKLGSEFSTAMLYIAHDLAVMARVSDEIAVMYAGEIVEKSNVDQIFANPFHPYTIGLINCVRNFSINRKERIQSIKGSLPDLISPPKGCIFRDRCRYAIPNCADQDVELIRVSEDREVSCVRWDDIQRLSTLRKSAEVDRSATRTREKKPGDGNLLALVNLQQYYGKGGWWGRLTKREQVKAVNGVTLNIGKNKTLGLVGESGCGKTTLGESIVELKEITNGRIYFKGQNITDLRRNYKKNRDFRKRVQIVFQNPDSSLNPRKRIQDIIGRPLEFFNIVQTKKEKVAKIRELLEKVRLPEDYVDRYPYELSGGEKQRVAIARAFATEPELVICDELTSALDVSVQGSILNLLIDLQKEAGISYLFISHDLSVVAYISDRIAVMYLGKIVEMGKTEDVFSPPYHPYVKALLSAVPVPNPNVRRERIRLVGAVPSPVHPPSGCLFNTRCPDKLGEICEKDAPPCRIITEDHIIYCHREIDEMDRVSLFDLM